MKIKSLKTEVVLRYKLRPSELVAAENSANKYYSRVRKSKSTLPEEKHPRRNIAISKDGVVHVHNMAGEHIISPKYVATVEYSPPVDLTSRLVSSHIFYLRELTNLPFPERRAEIVPAELRHLTGRWTFGQGTMGIGRKTEEPEPSYVVGVEIYGSLADPKLIRELGALVDNLYLPVQGKGGSWTTDTRGGGQGGPYPEIVMKKRYGGEIDSAAEKELIKFYRTILEFVLTHKLTENIRSPDGKETLAEAVQKHEGMDLRENIATSTVGRNSWYAPRLRIDGSVPDGHITPRLTFVRGGNYRRENTVPVMVLTYFADLVPPKSA